MPAGTTTKFWLLQCVSICIGLTLGSTETAVVWKSGAVAFHRPSESERLSIAEHDLHATRKHAAEFEREASAAKKRAEGLEKEAQDAKDRIKQLEAWIQTKEQTTEIDKIIPPLTIGSQPETKAEPATTAQEDPN
jgi:septal ring factor EnvC (AmiA/AmiB activator)